MKPQVTIAAVALAILGAGALLWTMSHRAIAPEPALTGHSAPLAQTSSSATPASTPDATSPAPLAAAPADADPHRELLAAVRAKFDQWRERSTGDADAEEKLANEMLALLTDANAAEIAQSLTSEELDTPFGRAALARWLEQDAATAARWVAARPDATEVQAHTVARALLQDAAQLGAFCDALPEGEWKQVFLNAAGLDGLSVDPALAIALAQRMEPGNAQTSLLQTVAYDWMSRDPAAASDWMAKVKDPAVREQLLGAAAKSIASSDPDLAAGWLASTVKSQQVASDTALCVVETWVERDPAKAAAWVAQFPPRASRDAAIGIVARHWLQADPDAATAWIMKLPERSAVLAQLEAERAERDRPPADPE